MERVIFTGFGVYIHRISGTQLTYFLDGQPGAGPFDIDLHNSPSHVPFRQVDIDDMHALQTGGATRVPLKGGARESIVYLSEVYLSNHAEISFPPYGYDAYVDRRYEFMSVQYSSHPSNGTLRDERYYGFHGVWFDGPRNAAYVAVWDGGTSLGTPKTGAPAPLPKARYVDLDDTSQVHPKDPYLRIDVVKGVPGPVFLSCWAASNTPSLAIPKLPAIAGGEPIDNCRRRTEP